MRNIWKITHLDGEPPAFAQQLALAPEVARLLTQRGITSTEAARAFLDPAHYPPAPSSALPDLLQATERIQKAIHNNETILIWGDFDVDGVCAAVILYETLSQLGAKVHVHIAQRHGIALETLRPLCTELRPALFITCDTGTNAKYAVDYTNTIGVDTIITDHHALPNELPPAFALINPKRLPFQHPQQTLSGAGVAFLLAAQLIASPNPELVGLGLVADVAELVADTRYWLQKSLASLRTTQRLGLVALAKVAEVDLTHLTADDIAFRLAPRLNAFGRLDDPTKVLRLLTTRNPAEANSLAAEANALNQQRQLITRQISAAARDQIEKDPSLLGWSALVLANPHWEGGVIGAAAAALAREYGRPVALLVPGETSTSGAVRSAEGYDVTAALAEVRDMLLTFGGHASAAGFSLATDALPAFRRRFSSAISEQQPDQNANELLIHAQLAPQHLTLAFAQQLEQLAPFGNGNPRPVFVTHGLSYVRSAKIGRTGQHRRLTLRDSTDQEKTVLWWNSNGLETPSGTIDLAYQIAPVFRDGEQELQITLVDWQPVTHAESPAPTPPQLIDCRTALDLDALRVQEPDLIIWAEGYSQSQNPGVPLSALTPAAALLIHTAPPSPAQLTKAIQKVQPQRIYVYGEAPPYDNAQKIAEATAALLRAALQNYQGVIKLAQIAERTAHTPETIKLALAALGDSIEITWQSKFTLRVIRADQPPQVQNTSLEKASAEAAAYRRFFRRAELDNLL